MISDVEINNSDEYSKSIKDHVKALKEDTENQKWTVRKDGFSVIHTRAEAFQLVGIVIQHLFKPLNFEKKFRIVIEHDPENENGLLKITHYE